VVELQQGAYDYHAPPGRPPPVPPIQVEEQGGYDGQVQNDGAGLKESFLVKEKNLRNVYERDYD
jgi:hypothetical protein